MGRPKALLPIAGETFVARIVRVLREGGAGDVVVVAGADADEVRASLASANSVARVAVNECVDDGQLSSLVVGLDAIDRPEVEATLVTPVDVPLVSVSTVRLVVERYRAVTVPVVRPVSGAKHGHPVCLDRAVFDALRAADPALGAKPIVRALASREGDVEVDDEWAFRDVDTPAEYTAMVAILPPDGGVVR